MNVLIPNPSQNQNLTQDGESTLRQNLTAEFQDRDYRYAYAESFLNTKLASQIRTLRQQRSLTQNQIAELMNIKQPGYARFEDVNHSVWKTDTLWDIARALDVRVNISFESFGTLIEEKEHFDKYHLERPAFVNDPVFEEPAKRRKRRKMRSAEHGARILHMTRKRRHAAEVEPKRKPPMQEYATARPEFTQIGVAGSAASGFSPMESNNNSATQRLSDLPSNLVVSGNEAYGS
jgi:transcriptional regulator with XRE-family HTH domain